MAREYDNIADAISAVNGEVSEQSTKIADILEALEGKAGGGIDVKSATRCEIVTIGTNTVANPVDALSYFGYSSPYAGFAVILLDTPTTQNQLGVVMSKPSATALFWWRWRDNSKNWPSSFNNSWDTRLVEGSKYLVIGY